MVQNEAVVCLTNLDLLLILVLSAVARAVTAALL